MRLVLIFCLGVGGRLNSRHECGGGCLVSGVFPMSCSSDLSGVIEVLDRPLQANIMALFVLW